jgi:hypothetical protein
MSPKAIQAVKHQSSSGPNPQEDFFMPISDNPENPFVRDLVGKFRNSNSSYVRDLAALDAALRDQTAHQIRAFLAPSARQPFTAASRLF